METDKSYFLVGLFVIAVVLGGFGITWWLARAGAGSVTEYQIRFSEAVGGLRLGSMVRFNGIEVGTVKNIEIDPKDPKLTQVDISILASTPVKTDTIATLQFLGVSGDLYIELSGGSPDKPDLVKVAKEYPPEIHAQTSDLTRVMDRLPRITEEAEVLLKKLSHTTDQVNKVFSDENIREVHSIIHGIDNFIGSDDDSKKDDRSANQSGGRQ